MTTCASARANFGIIRSLIFTFMCSVSWPLNRSGAMGDRDLLKTFLLFMYESCYSYFNKPVNIIIYMR